MAVEYRGELTERAAILRRFRELLVQQRAKFERYLLVLDHEKGDIEGGDVDALVAHVELEEQIVSEIFTFQKVIDPLEDLYRAAYPAAAAKPGEDEASELPVLRDSLAELRGELLRRNAENRELLRRRMDVLRGEIAGLRMPMRSRRSVYADSVEASLVDIQG
jgi:hypothetical protein